MTAEEAIERSLERYGAWEPELHAFAWCEPDRARELARTADALGPRPDLPLHGLPVGVKDIFDTAGIPTEYGSPIFAGHIPDSTAEAVERLEAAGAIVLGKTVTAELAYLYPGPTTNPWSAGRTPGGSSMGSAAAVAAGIVPVAIGTQTNGSTIRPAAFCGVVGFKPSLGRVPTVGALRFAPTMDTVGVFATRIADAAIVAAVLAGEPPVEWLPARPSRPPVLAIIRSPEWEESDTATMQNFKTVAALAGEAGAELHEHELPESLADSIPVLRAIMAVEASRFITPLVAGDLGRVSAPLRELLDEGATIAPGEYERMLARRTRAITELVGFAPQCDALLTLAALGEAPPLDTTGDPRPCTRWSLTGSPALALPSGLGPDGLPLGVQLVGRPGRDRELLGTAAWLESLVPTLVPPLRPL